MLMPMWIVYSIMLVGFFLAAVRGLQQCIFHIKHFRDKTVSLHQQIMSEAEEEASFVKGGVR